MSNAGLWAEVLSESMDVAVHPLSLGFSDPEVEQKFQDHRTQILYAYDDPVSFILTLVTYIAAASLVVPHLEPFSTGWLLALFYPIYPCKLACMRYFGSASYYKAQRQNMLLVCKVVSDVTAIVGLQHWISPAAGVDGSDLEVIRLFLLQSGILTMLWHCFGFKVSFKAQVPLQSLLVAVNLMVSTDFFCTAVLLQQAGQATVNRVWTSVQRLCQITAAIGRPTVFVEPLVVDVQTSQCGLSLLLVQLLLGWMLPLVILYHMERYSRQRFLRVVVQRPQAVMFENRATATMASVVTVGLVCGTTIIVWELAAFALLAAGLA